ncbi:MAG: class D sortase [Lachnospiraceae bacterium]|nr:class D sortase [Lachnospiraceae bacterium]
MLIILGIGLFVGIVTVNIRDISKSIKAVEEFNLRKDTENTVDDASLPVVENQLSNDTYVYEKIKENNDTDNIDKETNPAKYSGGEIICLLRIPKISLEEAVREGDSRDVLSSALCHLEKTSYPGQQGNCCISGHRNYVFGKYFNRLNEVSVGDIVELETIESTYRYQVYETLVVEPDDVKVLDSTGQKNLTLVTCTPLFVGTHRLIVKAVLVE